MKKLKVHVLYEYGIDMRPHGSAYLRLIRPLSHPLMQEKLEVTFGREMVNYASPDLVLVDRLWRRDIQPQKVNALAEEVRQCMGRLVYCFDDNFLEVGARDTRIRAAQKESFEALLEKSDGLIVTTRVLQETFGKDKPALIFPQALDERLIVRKCQPAGLGQPKIVIGYMGTRTHDGDLEMVAPALQAVNAKYPGRLQFQFAGVLDEKSRRDWAAIKGLPIEIIQPAPVEIEYPAFMLWFTANTHWDIAIAPLVDDAFNKSKSDIKLLDYTAAGVPGIYSSVAAYAGSVEHRKTGLLVENTTEAWTSALCEMIEHETLRREILQNATETLYQKRIMRVCASDWLAKLFQFA